MFARLRDAGLGSTPGTAAEVLHDGVRERISPNKLPVARWVEIIEASHRAGLRSTATVMFGHIEEPWELAEHMRVVRELQERTGGITEFVPLSFIPFQTLLGRTHGVEEISREENLKHTAVFRLALGRTVPSLQASWVKMGLDAATESLRWGVNDLGGTLMEESISRLAGSYHGTRLDPEQLDRRRARGGPARGRAHDAVRDQAPLRAAGRRRRLAEQVLLQRSQQRHRARPVLGGDEPLQAVDQHDGLARVLGAGEVGGCGGGVGDRQPGRAAAPARRVGRARASPPAASCRRSRSPRRTARDARRGRSCR